MSRRLLAVLLLSVAACERESESNDVGPDRVPPSRASASSRPTPKPERVQLLLIDRSACARLGVNLDDVIDLLKSAKVTVGEPRTSTEYDAPATVVEVAGVDDLAALMAMRLGKTTPVVLAQVARFEVRRP